MIKKCIGQGQCYLAPPMSSHPGEVDSIKSEDAFRYLWGITYFEQFNPLLEVPQGLARNIDWTFNEVNRCFGFLYIMFFILYDIIFISLNTYWWLYFELLFIYHPQDFIYIILWNDNSKNITVSGSWSLKCQFDSCFQCHLGLRSEMVKKWYDFMLLFVHLSLFLCVSRIFIEEVITYLCVSIFSSHRRQYYYILFILLWALELFNARVC